MNKHNNCMARNVVQQSSMEHEWVEITNCNIYVLKNMLIVDLMMIYNFNTKFCPIKLV